jgi:RNA polymerase sigma factor (sigma-70 family)
MANPQAETLLRHIRSLAEGDAAPPDSELLERFASRRDETAFAELVRRHGSMVLSVCRGVLHHWQDAEDAFQATFLVLARKAASVRKLSLGGWLHTVAYHLACKARTRSARRRDVERQAEPAPACTPPDLTVRELLQAVHEELSRLPQKYRVPLVLCYLQERTQDEAARELGCSEDALRGRLYRGREWLRARLARRGLTLPAGLSAFLLANGLAVAVPGSLADGAVRAAGGPAPAHVSALAETGLRALAPLKVRGAALLGLALGMLGLAAGLLPWAQPEAPRPELVQAQEKGPRKEEKPAADVHGGALPAGAVARLGSLRWRHPARVLVFSPDGRYLAATGNTTHLFDAHSGELRHVLAGPSSHAFFCPDNKTLITTPYGAPFAMRFWDLSTGKERRQIRVANAGSFQPSWSANGSLMACYSFQPPKGPVVSFVDMDSGKEIRTWEKPLGGRSINRLALAPDGKTVALREQTTTYLFDVATRKELRRFTSPVGAGGQTVGTCIVVFSPDGRRLMCTENSSVRVWETATGKSVHHFTGIPGGAVAVAASPNGRFLAAGAEQGMVSLWDLATGRLIRAFDASGCGMPVYLLAFSADSKRLATQAHMLQSIRLWEVASGRELPSAETPATPVAGLAFGPAGKRVVTADAEGSVWLWDTATGKLRRRFPGTSALGLNHPMSTAILPGGQTLVRGAYESEVVSWDLQTGKRLHTGKREGKVPTIDSSLGAELYPECSPNGRTVVAVFPGEVKRRIEPPAGRGPPPPPTIVHWTMIGLWDAPTGKMTRAFRVDAEHLRRVALSPDGRLLAGRGRLPEDLAKTWLFVWDLARGRELRRFEIPALDGWNPVAFSADGRTLLSGLHHSAAEKKTSFYFWEVATGRQRAAVECALETRSAWLTSFAGERLAALAIEEKVYLVDPLTGKELRRLDGHLGWVDRLEFSSDGKRLASGSRDTTTLVWEVTEVLPAEKPVRLSAKEVAERLEELAGNDAERAYRAVRLLARAPAQAVALIGKHVQPVPFPQRAAVARLLAALDSKEFAQREKATQELQQLGEVAEAALRQLLDNQPSLEVRRRAEGILAKMKEAETKAPPVPSGEALRVLRALEVLERAGTPEAERLLGRLAEGAPHAALTREARGSWERLNKRRAAAW